MSAKTSNVKFVSNVYPVQEKMIINDREFLSNIKNPTALEELKKNPYTKLTYHFTHEQNDIFYKVSVHCEFAKKNDYPWGSVLDKNGNEKVICKCENKKCELFYDCRSDLKEN